MRTEKKESNIIRKGKLIMSTVLPREEAVEAIFSKILASSEASGRLSGVFYDHIDDDHRLTDNDRDHFLQVLFHAYENGDISALLLELCGSSARAVRCRLKCHNERNPSP